MEVAGVPVPWTRNEITAIHVESAPSIQILHLKYHGQIKQPIPVVWSSSEKSASVALAGEPNSTFRTAEFS